MCLQRRALEHLEGARRLSFGSIRKKRHSPLINADEVLRTHRGIGRPVLLVGTAGGEKIDDADGRIAEAVRYEYRTYLAMRQFEHGLVFGPYLGRVRV